MISSLVPLLASAAGITAYLPADLPAPEARQLTLVFALADEPVMRRPVSVAAVERAMERACPRDPALCDAVGHWLARYRAPLALTGIEAELAAADHTAVPLPNRQGLLSTDDWQVRAAAQWQPLRSVVIGAGLIARQGEVVPTGTLVSLGNEVFRLDAGFQDLWLSPTPDSAFLQSTQAATRMAVSVSNERPLTRWRLRYLVQVSRLSRSEGIVEDGIPSSGYPRLATLSLSVQPAAGWSLGATRQLQYGGGKRDSGAASLLKAFFAPNHYDNFRPGRPEEFGNQQAAWSSRFVYPGTRPVVVSMEFAGEDTSHGTPGRLGNAGLTLGVEVPRLWRTLGLRYEVSEWQNSWYTHHLYTEGLVNRGQVLGHWGAAWRAPRSDVGGRSQSLQLQWSLAHGRALELNWRQLANQSYSPVAYHAAHQIGATFTAPLGRFLAGTELLTGRDVFGDRFYRLAAFARLGQGTAVPASGGEGAAGEAGASMFVDAGVAYSKVNLTRDGGGATLRRGAFAPAPHLGLGLRRAVGAHGDIGVRLELDRVDGDALVAVRALDYRYRVGASLAVTAFAGAARLDRATPAYGYYVGGGAQWRDLRPGWDLGFELRYGDKLARDELAPGGQLLGNFDTFNDLYGASLYLSRRF